MYHQDKFKIRTITGFLSLHPHDFALSATDDDSGSSRLLLEDKVSEVVSTLRQVQAALVHAGYAVQTVRLATNPLGEWLDLERLDEQLQRLDACLEVLGIDFCALGPAETVAHVRECCPRIVAASFRFSCCATLSQADAIMAKAAASCVQTIAALDDTTHVQGGLGNFRFCVAAAAKDCIPFFPVAKAPKTDPSHDEVPCFAVGLENGTLAQHLLQECHSIHQVSSVFRDGMAQALEPIQSICKQAIQGVPNMRFVGIDSSLNPSLDEHGSVAKAMEALAEVQTFGRPGTLAAAAAITQSLQYLPGIELAGYCGLMLPLCEDQRLAELANAGSLRIPDLLSISQVCGVGLDTIPIPGNVDTEELASLLLDVAGIAHRWGKSLSCRLFPVPGKRAGEPTTFDSPYMVNATVLPLSP